MDISKLKTGDWVIGVSSLLLLIASFLDWFTSELEGFTRGAVSVGRSGWDVGFFWAGIPVILGLAMVAVVAIRAFSPETKLPALPVGWGQALFIAGCVAAVIVVLKLLIGEDADGAEAFGIEVKRAFGLFLAALSAIGLAVGGFLTWQGEKAGDLAFNSSGPADSAGPGYPPPGGSTPPPPPPAGGQGGTPPPPPPAPGTGY